MHGHSRSKELQKVTNMRLDSKQSRYLQELLCQALIELVIFVEMISCPELQALALLSRQLALVLLLLLLIIGIFVFFLFLEDDLLQRGYGG